MILRNFSKKATTNQCVKGELELVTILFYNGTRSPIRKEGYPNNPNELCSYFPHGDGTLTKVGKCQMFCLGENMRTRYDWFLKPEYIPEQVKVVSNESFRSQASAMLMTAGLFPPPRLQQWHSEQQWQPIPYTYLPFYQDKYLVRPLLRNTKYAKMYKAAADSEYGKSLLIKYKKQLDEISKHSGINPITIYDIYKLYKTLTCENNIELKTPRWARSYFPIPIEEIAMHVFILETLTEEMRMRAGGFLTRQIYKDMEEKITDGRFKLKIILYSGHDHAISHQLRILNAFEPHIPDYGAYMIWELWRFPETYGVKVYYQKCSCIRCEPKYLVLSDTTVGFCPWKEYQQRIAPYIGPCLVE